MSKGHPLPAPVAAPDRELQQKFRRARREGIGIENFFREFLGSFLSEKTRRCYLNDLKFFYQFLGRGGERIAHPRDIKAFHFTLYRDWMMEQKYASATIGRRMVAIRSFIKWALACKLIDHDPLQAIKLPRIETLAPTQAFDDGEVRDMIDLPDTQSFTGNTHRLVLVLLFHLGLRRGEVVKIKLEHIRRERGHTALFILGKGSKGRLVALNSIVMREIKDYQKRFAQLTGGRLGPRDFLIQTRSSHKNTGPCNGSTIYRIVNRYAKALGISKRVGPHSCRATVISHLLDTQKTPIRDVADFAGHQQTSTTERYDKKRKGLDENAAYEVDYSAEDCE